MGGDAPARLDALDFIRGVAVLGILTINIAGFAGPPSGALSPHLPSQGSLADEMVFAVNFVLFEGKMRGLFCLLFGASLVLFIDREDAKGGLGEILQMRRLGWLMLIGLAHYYLFWWGDILFSYALAGMLLLFARELPARTILIAAIVIFVAWHLAGMAISAPDVVAEQQVLAGTASGTEQQAYATYLDAVRDNAAGELAAYKGGFWQLALYRVTEWTFQPLAVAFSSMREILPLMVAGMLLLRSGFFTGGWPRRRLVLLAGWGTGSGLALTLALIAWALRHDFPPRAMEAMFFYWTALPHLLLTLGYAAILVLLAPEAAKSALGRRLIAAGRMAFSNYLGTTMVMTAIFYGWGFGLAGAVDPAAQWLFVLLGWALMLAWSRPWLAHFRRGPLEWTWRSLTEKRLVGFRR